MCISCLNLSSELQLCLSKSKILGHFLLEILEVNILTDAVYAGNFNGNDPLHHIRFMSSSQQPPATHPATHPPETHTVDEHVGLMGNCWETGGTDREKHFQIINCLIQIISWACDVESKIPIAWAYSRELAASHWSSWSKVYRTSGSQQFKKWRLKTWKRLEILPFALVHGPARVFPLVMLCLSFINPSQL